ncbi:aminopeptidase P family protein [Ramlibacter sp. G-1-2-2]|uniref:Aminopeptidase P family protein n=1 Tax=Ramlibacter agri TaxID=2728837 RepID=A0A848H5S9_9BURK|nr:Xaa-Pro peptidase family protein [Ramlibacter agri]NML44630.1 aminopeptidase P family protein [Ramlibacter agri]
MESIWPDDTGDEFARRRAAVQQSLHARGVRRLVLTSTEAIYYLTGATYEPLERPVFLIVDAEWTDYKLLVPLLERTHLEKAWGVRPAGILTYREYPAPSGEGWADRILPLLDARFLFEPGTPFEIADHFVRSRGKPVDVLGAIRLVKSPWEIEQIKRAAKYADWGLQKVLQASYYGATVAEVYAAASVLQRKVIREVPDYDALASKSICAPWPAPLSSEPHSVPPLRMKLERGPHVALALTRVNGYAAECERTFFTAPPLPEERERFELMRAARRLVARHARPGASCHELDGAVNRFLEEKGWTPALRLHRVGHGFGLGNHEPPWLAEGSSDVLAANMVISIEPGLYQTGVGGYRHSDTFLVTDDGVQRLTHAPDTLEALTLRSRSLSHRVRAVFVQRALGTHSAPVRGVHVQTRASGVAAPPA